MRSAFAVRVALAAMVAACSRGTPLSAQGVGVDKSGAPARAGAPELNYLEDVRAVMPPSVRDLVDGLPSPRDGQPSVLTRFTRGTVQVGQPAELVTVIWFPRTLSASLRRQPILTRPFISGASGPSRQPPIVGGIRINGGTVYDLYVTWQTIPTLRSGRIEATSAVVAYEPPVARTFVLAPAELLTVRSPPTALVVRQ